MNRDVDDTIKTSVLKVLESYKNTQLNVASETARNLLADSITNEIRQNIGQIIADVLDEIAEEE